MIGTRLVSNTSEDENSQWSVSEFAASIKEKYPAYKEWNDQELVDAILKKYPVYENQVDLKKKTTSDSSETVEAVDAISAIGSLDSEEVVEGREVEVPQASYVVDGQDVDKQTIMSVISDPNKITEAQEITITNDDQLNTILKNNTPQEAWKALWKEKTGLDADSYGISQEMAASAFTNDAEDMDDTEPSTRYDDAVNQIEHIIKTKPKNIIPSLERLFKDEDFSFKGDGDSIIITAPNQETISLDLPPEGVGFGDILKSSMLGKGVGTAVAIKEIGKVVKRTLTKEESDNLDKVKEFLRINKGETEYNPNKFISNADRKQVTEDYYEKEEELVDKGEQLMEAYQEVLKRDKAYSRLTTHQLWQLGDEYKLYLTQRQSVIDQFNNLETEWKVLNEEKKELQKLDDEFKDYKLDTGVREYKNTIAEELAGVRGVGGFLSNMWRAAVRGPKMSGHVDETMVVFGDTKEAKPQDVAAFVDATIQAMETPPSENMELWERNVEKFKEDGHSGLLSFLLATAKMPDHVPELMAESMAMMSNKQVLKTAMRTFGTITGRAAATGAAAGGPAGGVAAWLASLPLAIPATMLFMTNTLETGITFAEFMVEEVGGIDNLTVEKTQELLNDEELMQKFKRRARARGIAIGTFEALGLALGGKALSSLRTAGKTARAVPAAALVDVGAGSLGEYAGMVMAGQEKDPKEIYLEGIGSLWNFPVTVAAATVKQPTYRINGESYTAQEYLKFLDEASFDEIAGATLEVTNNPEINQLSKKKKGVAFNEATIINSLDKVVSENLTNEQKENLVKLELELRQLEAEGDQTETSKLRMSEVRNEIREINEVAKTQVKETGSPQEKRIREIDKLINKLQKAAPGQPVMNTAEEMKEIEKLKAEKDALFKEMADKKIKLTAQEKEVADALGFEITDEMETVEDNFVINNTDNVQDTSPFKQFIDQATKGAKAISSLLPEVNIVLHTTADQYQKAGNDINERGTYNPETKTIHLNAENMNSRTVAHEVFHATLIETFKGNQESLTQFTDNLVTKLDKVLTKEQKQKLKTFVEANPYENNLVGEEQLAELLGLISSEYNNLSLDAKDTVKEWIKSALQVLKLDFDVVTQYLETDADVVNLLNTLSKKVRTGETLVQEDVTLLEGEDVVVEEVEVETKKKPKSKKEETKRRKQYAFSKNYSTIGEIAQAYNMNSSGFISPSAALYQVKELIRPFGYTLHQAKSGSYFLRTPSGKFYRPAFKRRMQKSGKPTSIFEYVRQGRQAGFKDAEILSVLEKKGVGTRAEIKKVMTIRSKDMGTLPTAFAIIEQGIKKGNALFKSITKKKTLDTALNALHKSPIYEKATEAQKTAMDVAITELYDKGTPRDMVRRIQNARDMIKDLSVTKNLQTLKRKLKNFMRAALPVDLLDTKEVTDMMSRIDKATKAEMSELVNEVIEYTNTLNSNKLESQVTQTLNTLGKVNKKLRKIISDGIKSVKPADSVADIVTEINKLQEKINNLQDKEQLSAEDIETLLSYEAAQNILMSYTMQDNQVDNVSSLNRAVEILEDLITGDKNRMKNQAKEQHSKYNNQASILLQTVLGIKKSLDMSNKKDRALVEKKLKELQKKKDYKKITPKTIAGQLLQQVVSFLPILFKAPVVSALDLSGLMAQIDMLPGKLFGGKLQRLVTDMVNAGTRLYKQRLMMVEDMIEAEALKIFGKDKNWRGKYKYISIFKNFSNRTDTNIFENKKDEEVYKKGKKDFEEGKITSKEWIDIKEKHGPLVLSQAEIAYLYMQYKNKDTHPAFKARWGKETERIMEQLTEQLDSKLKQFSDWQTDVLFPSLYEHYNEAYRDLYRTDMPQVQFYGGRLYRKDFQPADDNINMLGNKVNPNSSIFAASIMERETNSNNPILIDVNSLNNLMSYVQNMEYWAAMGRPVRDMHKMFNNSKVKEAIVQLHGMETWEMIAGEKGMLSKLANKNVRNSGLDRFINTINTTFTVGALAGQAVIMLKQLTSFKTYAARIGYRNWIKNLLVPFTAEWNKLSKEINKNSVYIQYRYRDSIIKSLQSYAETNRDTRFSGNIVKDTFQELAWYGMIGVRWGDYGAIIFGGLPVYRAAKAKAEAKGLKGQAAIDYAIKEFEDATKQTQQSADIQDKDYYQTGDPIPRGLNMFMTTPKQYLRKQIDATRNLYRIYAKGGEGAKGTAWENWRQLITYQVMLPVLFQAVTTGFAGIFRDRDRDDEWVDLLRAAVIGNLNAFFILGDMVNMIADAFTDKPWTGKGKMIGSTAVMSEIAIDLKKYRAAKSEEERKELMWDILARVASLTGAPAPTLQKWKKNMKAIIDDPNMPADEFIMRLLNYSEFQVTGGKDAKKEVDYNYGPKYKHDSSFY